MARELGMNPRRLERIDDHREKEWKVPLPEYIENQYLKRFGKEQPDSDLSVEDRVRQAEAKKSAKRQEKRMKLSAERLAIRQAEKLKAQKDARKSRISKSGSSKASSKSSNPEPKNTAVDGA